MPLVPPLRLTRKDAPGASGDSCAGGVSVPSETPKRGPDRRVTVRRATEEKPPHGVLEVVVICSEHFAKNRATRGVGRIRDLTLGCQDSKVYGVEHLGDSISVEPTVGNSTAGWRRVLHSADEHGQRPCLAGLHELHEALSVATMILARTLTGATT